MPIKITTGNFFQRWFPAVGNFINRHHFLYSAISRNMTWTARFFIFLGANPNAKCPTWSPFAGQPLTAAPSDRGTIAALIKDGANLDSLSDNVRQAKPPIVHSRAFWHGGKRISRAILSRKDFDINAVDHNGHTALHNAILYRTDVSFAIRLINHPRTNIYARTPEGNNAHELLNEILVYATGKLRERALKIHKALTARHLKERKKHSTFFANLLSYRNAITPSYRHSTRIPRPYINSLAENLSASPLSIPSMSNRRDHACRSPISFNRSL